MGKIICYCAGAKHPAIAPNMRSLAEGFRALGHEAVLCDCTDGAQVAACLKQLCEQPDSLAFTVGNNDLFLEIHADGDKWHPYAECDTPHVSVMLDVPYNAASSGWDLPCRRHLVTLLDRNVASYLPLACPDKEMETLFLPLGGTEHLPKEQLFSGSRPYDVVVSAGFYVGESWPARIWRRADVPRTVRAVLDEAADLLETDPMNTWDGVRHVLAARGMLTKGERYAKGMIPYLSLLQRYIKQYRRLKAVAFLVEAGITPDVFGAGWESVPFADALRLHGGTTYAEMLDIVGKAKIVYQDNAEFANGAHDRVFTAMLNGATVVSETSTYLADEFQDGTEIFLFDWKQGARRVAEVIPALLADEPLRLSAALRAYAKAKARHTWTHRAARIAEAVELLYGRS